jgi:hypothetical protein
VGAGYEQAIKDLQSLAVVRYYMVWEPFLRKYDCQTIAEIGVYRGENFKRLIAHTPRLAVAVDAWTDDGVVSRNDGVASQSELDDMYNTFAGEMADKPFVRVVRDYSFEAVKRFPDEFFDLVYIDADHTYEACQRDLADWYPKVKHGGLLLGHDYVRAKVAATGVRFGVIRAVNEFVAQHDLRDRFFLMARRNWGIIKP